MSKRIATAVTSPFQTVIRFGTGLPRGGRSVNNFLGFVSGIRHTNEPGADAFCRASRAQPCSWGYGPSGIVGFLLLIVLILFLMGRL